MTAYFVSDIHLKSPDEPSAQRFEKFLRRLVVAGANDGQRPSAAGILPASPTHLFLVGDIFDLWIGRHAYFRDRFEIIVDLIRTLVRAGVKVHFFEGNHDLHLDKFWSGEIGVEVHADGELFELGGRKILVEHGDRINPDDKGYLFLRWLLRTRPVRFLAENLPSRIVAGIGERASHASRGYTSGDGSKAVASEDVRAMIRRFAEKRFAEQSFDFIVTGHVHVLDDFEFRRGDQVVRSVNLGSWFDGQRALKFDDSGGALVAEWIDLATI